MCGGEGGGGGGGGGGGKRGTIGDPDMVALVLTMVSRSLC